MDENISTYRIIKSFLRTISQSSSRILVATCATFINKMLDFLPEMFIGMSIDIVTQDQGSFIARYFPYQIKTQLLILASVTLVAWLLESLVEYCAKYSWSMFALSVQHTIRTKLYEHIQTLDLSFFDQTHLGKITSTIIDDVHQLERFFDRGIMELLKLIFGSVIALIVFFVISPFITLFMLLPVPLIFFLSRYFHHHLSKLYAAARAQSAIMLSHIATSIAGILVIKSYVSEKRELQTLIQESECYNNLNHAVIKTRSLFIPSVRTVIVIGFVSALVLGGFQVSEGTLSVGLYSILVIMTQRFLWPFTELPKITDMYAKTMASARRIVHLFNKVGHITDGIAELRPETMRGDVAFDNVSFSYPGNANVLHNVSFSIPHGSMAAFVGTTGSGKSTIAKLLLRFYDLDNGTITIDGIDIRSFTIDSLRASIGYVNQDPFLYDMTIRENIAYGTPFSDFDDIIRASIAVNAHNFITELQNGYDTPVGDGGQKLSGGQRQKIAIARALVKKPPIFIFDEITSSLDNETETFIQHSLETIIRKKHTAIIIAHRLKMVQTADIIFVLDKGHIVEMGTHQELIEKNGVYKTLWESRF